MPLEIKELHIKVTVNQPKSNQVASSDGSGNKGDEEKEALVSQCIEGMLEVIKNKNER